MAYFDLIGEEYFKKRKAMLEYTGQDVAMTTKLMDIDDERLLLIRTEIGRQTVGTLQNTKLCRTFFLL